MGIWDTVSETVGGAWDTVAGGVSSLWNSAPKDEGPIVVPVTAKDEENAAAMNARADAWAKAGHTKSAGEEQMDRNVADWKARDAGFPNKQAQDDYRRGAAAWDEALDKFLAGKGPNPGPKNEFIEKANPDR